MYIIFVLISKIVLHLIYNTQIMNRFDKEFWNSKYINQDTGWDMGMVSPPIKHYMDSIDDYTLKILIPGGGNCYEIEYLFQKGFKNTYLLDICPEPIENCVLRNPQIDASKLLCGDFFEHQGQYDLILEQTFFCALDPSYRERYLKQVHQLLKPGGKLVGVLFDAPLNVDKPPFGGNMEEYYKLFSTLFSINKMELCYNSIPARAGRELFIEFVAKPL